MPAQDPLTNSYVQYITTNPAVNRLNARLGLRFPGGADVSLFATNLLNAHPLINRYDGLVNIETGAFTIPPRTYGVGLLYHW